ncbi:LPS export ABC transporter periplasmic protein LptC [Thiomicrospira microaerophila]|uniref:LPS export ABC transporter periplasmic protein LptC n=1 Tax=Thiomicrospira microaerophila TaxID=406020 RepID=UPI00200EB987|nr:LPS export ABC transporter periplasmic protein LptC [Thiomicrospira microaerophila]UQB42922.1 LPS export ABC transporter periplasmic protein LptC [Thiomicrospira microaerophila]
MKFKSGVLITTTLGLIALIFTQYQQVEQDTNLAAQLSQNDWHGEQIKSWSLNSNQTLLYFEAKSLYQHAGNVFIAQPQVIRTSPKDTYIISSQEAQIQQQSLYQFKHDVLVSHYTEQNRDEYTSRLETEELYYHPNTERLTSPYQVIIQSSQQRTQGIGLEIDLLSQQTQIHSQVKTQYDINPAY